MRIRSVALPSPPTRSRLPYTTLFRSWHKGATSGNTQRVVDIAADCDRDALVVSVEPSGPACHTGAFSCFPDVPPPALDLEDRKSTRLNSSHVAISYAVFCLKKKKTVH